MWWHTAHPHLLDPYFHVPLFFFISGILYHKKTFKFFLSKKIRTLVIPLIFFYLLSYLFTIILYAWDHRTLSGFNWWIILDIFQWLAKGGFLYINVPLWFIVCLVDIEFIYFFISKLPIWCRVILSMCFILLGQQLVTFNAPLLLNHAFYWCAYYIIGDIFGKRYIRSIDNIKTKAIIVSGGLFLATTLGQHYLSQPTMAFYCYHIRTLSFIFCIIPIFSFFNEKKWMQPLRFYGQNSLVVAGLHVCFIITFQKIFNHFFNGITPFIGFWVTVLTLLCLYFIIILINKYIPWVVGKKTEVAHASRTDTKRCAECH